MRESFKKEAGSCPQAVLLDELNLASLSLLGILETWILEMRTSGKYMPSNGEVVNHGQITVSSIYTTRNT
jgi:hypothetical protein